MKKVTKITVRKVSVAKAKIVTFIARSWDDIQRAYMNLKTKFRRTVKLGKLKAMGAGLFTGSFTLA